jgi:predicted small secreted protein
MKKLMLGFLLVSAFVLSACNTMHGVGKDLEAAGEAVQKNSK